MKANELMIDDWIAIDVPDRYAGATGQIKSLFHHQKEDAAYFHVFIQGKFGYLTKEVCSDDIRPISLTPMILGKNDFKLLAGVWYLQTKERMPIQIVFKDNNVITLSINCTPVPINLKYVHQLQHALKLYNILKEIII